jgi:hypothetical protein
MNRVEKGLVLLATAVTLAVNGLANTGALGGVTTGEVAGRFNLPFTPAGYVFAIWGLIYLGLIAFSLFQLGRAGATSERLAGLRPVYVFSAAANIAWLWFWHHQAPVAALAVMLLLLSSLLAARRTLSVAPAASATEFWCVDAPFRLYLAWICIATLANLAVVIVYGGDAAEPRSAMVVSLAMLATALAIAVFAYQVLRDPIFLAVIAWAAVGIALRHGQPMLVSAPAMAVAALAGLGAIGVLLEDARGLARQPTTR